MSGRDLTLVQRFGSEETTLNVLKNKINDTIRVAIPGIIKSFDSETQTVTVQPALMEKIKDVDGKIIDVQLPELLDVPIVFPRSGGFSLTMPINVGDECLVIFSDMCIDAWWASGGIQVQEELRRHDLSDAIAIVGIWSQVNKVSNYSQTKAVLQHESSGNKIEVSSDSVNLSGNIKVNGQNLSDYIISVSGPWPHSHG